MTEMRYLKNILKRNMDKNVEIYDHEDNIKDGSGKLIFKPIKAEKFHYYYKIYGLRHSKTCDSVSL